MLYRLIGGNLKSSQVIGGVEGTRTPVLDAKLILHLVETLTTPFILF